MPRPPYLEIGVYFGRDPRGNNLLSVLRALQGVGVTPSGFVGEWTEPATTFGALTERPIEPRLVEPADVLETVARKGRDVAQVHMRGFIESDPAIVTVLSISESAAAVDSHPVALWTQGEGLMVDAPSANAYAARAVSVLFHLANSLPVWYGAVTVDYGLECLYDLQTRGQSDAFSDFFLSTRVFPASLIRDVVATYAGAYVEYLEHAVYISCSPVFNPARQSLADWEARSEVVVRLVSASV